MTDIFDIKKNALYFIFDYKINLIYIILFILWCFIVFLIRKFKKNKITKIDIVEEKKESINIDDLISNLRKNITKYDNKEFFLIIKNIFLNFVTKKTWINHKNLTLKEFELKNSEIKYTTFYKEIYNFWYSPNNDFSLEQKEILIEKLAWFLNNK